MRPKLFIIAGANGAGKTTYVCEHVLPGIFIFNGDDVYAELLKRYPNYDRELLKGGVPQQMEKDIDSAILSKSDFAFETNFASELSVDVAKKFINAGYEANLIYFGLDNVQQAALRVDHRVALGGHNLSTHEIRENFKGGLSLVKGNLKLFDTIKFVDTSIYGIAPVIAYYIKSNAKHVIANNSIEWYNANFKQPILDLAASRIREMEREISLKLLKGKSKGPGDDLDMGGPKIGR